jgi:hypothetical protein
MLLKPAAQKLKEILDSSMRSSRRAITPGWLPVELWCRSAAVSSRVFALVFCKTLFDNKYIILWHWLLCIHFLYGMCVNLIPGHTYYEYSVWVLKAANGFSMAKNILPLKPRQIKTSAKLNQRRQLPLKQAPNSTKNSNPPWSREHKVSSIELRQSSRQA